MIGYDHPLVRRVLCPFYSVWEVITFVIIVVLAFIFSTLFAGPDRAPALAACAAIGIMYVGYTASPARMIRSPGDKRRVEQFLASVGYTYSPHAQGWIPPLPRFLRWPHNIVRMSIVGEELLVTGPLNMIKAILMSLQPAATSSAG